MNIQKFVPKVVSSTVGRQLLVGQKHSPTIMFATGVVGVVATAVLASKATLKVHDVLDEALVEMATVDSLAGEHEKYPEELARRDRTIIHVQTALKLAKLYAPTIGVGVLSIGLLTGSHVTLTRRNAGMVAAYGVMEKAFGEYRDRVAEKYGREEEERLYISTQEEQIKRAEAGGGAHDPKKPWSASPYSALFGPDNPNWNPTPEYNLLFLKAQQNYLNDLLNARGHVFLNDVLDQLGMYRRPEAAVVGWLKGGAGDGYIDFGIFNDDMTERVYEWVIGREESVLLNFNPDGTIWDKI